MGNDEVKKKQIRKVDQSKNIRNFHWWSIYQMANEDPSKAKLYLIEKQLFINTTMFFLIFLFDKEAIIHPILKKREKKGSLFNGSYLYIKKDQNAVS